MRDAFGRLCVAPSRLAYPERLEVFRGFLGWLHTTDRLDAEWIAGALSEWLVDGGDLPSILGLRPEPGSTSTPTNLLRQEECDRLLVQLSVAVGGHDRASRILKGSEPAPTLVSDTVNRLRQLNAPTSTRAFNRARKRRGLV